MARAVALTGTAAMLFSSGGAVAQTPALIAFPRFVEAPDTTNSAANPVCTTPLPVHHYADFHCYLPQDIYAAYHIDTFRGSTPTPAQLGAGQTIVLVDSYGSPTAANDLKYFADHVVRPLYSNLPEPNFSEVYPDGVLTYNNTAAGNGLSGPSAATGWSGEATLDIEWAYAMAPLAHIVLLATNPAETLGVQGLPNMFKDIRWAIDNYPAGTVFSQSFGTAEQNFGGAMAEQQASFDQTYQYGIRTKHDTFVASSGDSGSGGSDKLHKEGGVFGYQVVDYPGSSPYNLTIGGTQLMYNWLWAPKSDNAFNSDGSLNDDFFNSDSATGVAAEPVWKESYLGGNDTSAGGASAVYPRPAWQSQQADIVGNHRGEPDISWDASVNGGPLIYLTAFPNAIRPGWHVTGGTSAASPQIAGLLADVNALRAEGGKSPIGDPHAAVYALGDGSNASTYYRDVTPQYFGSVTFPLIDNQWDGTPNVDGQHVLTGWDMTTGFGSPLVDAWIPALVSG